MTITKWNPISEPFQRFGAIVRRARHDMYLTQTGLARLMSEQCGVRTSSDRISKIERGESELTLDRIEALASILSLQPDELELVRPTQADLPVEQELDAEQESPAEQSHVWIAETSGGLEIFTSEIEAYRAVAGDLVRSARLVQRES